jgi:hypothetical protein
MNYSRVFNRWDITADTFLAGRNVKCIIRWLRLYAPNAAVDVNEFDGQMFAMLASRLRDGRLMASVMHLSGGPGYRVNLVEFKEEAR